MLSIFSAPKAFTPDVADLQKNAVGSWARLLPDGEIILLGDESGIEEVAKEAGATYVPEIERNEHQTPFINDIFAQAEAVAKNEILCYVNGDIVLTEDFTDAVRKTAERFDRFLMIGGRWNLDVVGPLDFSSGWQDRLRTRARTEGELYGPTGIDYFVFRKGTLGPLPSFLVGRPAWDNWTVFQARSRGLTVVNATAATTVIHQNHGYGHVPGGSGKIWDGPENRENWNLTEGFSRLFTIEDAMWDLTAEGFRSTWHFGNYWRRMRAWMLLQPWLFSLWRKWEEFRAYPRGLFSGIWRRLRGRGK